MNINASFNRAMGQAVSIYSSEVNGFLVIAKMDKFNPIKKENTVLISNNPLIRDCEMIFADDDFFNALEAYQALQGAERLVIQNDIARFRLENVIDLQGRKDNGDEKWNISTLENGHLAVLATCLYFYRHAKIDSMEKEINNAFDELEKIQNNELKNGVNIENFFITI